MVGKADPCPSVAPSPRPACRFASQAKAAERSREPNKTTVNGTRAMTPEGGLRSAVDVDTSVPSLKFLAV